MIGAASARRTRTRWPRPMTRPDFSPVRVWVSGSWRKYSRPSAEIGTSPSAPVSSSFTKSAEAGDAGDRARELRADAVGEVGGEVAVGGVALGHHRAALGHRDVLAGLGEADLLVVGQPVLPPAVGTDQRAVHDEVGVAPDRRGEMAVARQVQAEVAEVLRRVVGLGHRAQHAHVDHLGVLGAGDAVEQAVEVGGLEHLALGEGQADGSDDLAQRLELLGVRLLVDAVEQVDALRFQRLGGGDVGEDHEVLDDPVGVEAVAEGDRQDLALVGEDDPALGQVEVERRPHRRGPCAPPPRRPRAARMTASTNGAVASSGRPSAASWAWR